MFDLSKVKYLCLVKGSYNFWWKNEMIVNCLVENGSVDCIVKL